MDINHALRILEVQEDVTEEYLKKQFRKLCLQWHPDRNKIDTKDRFIEIQQAYEIMKKYIDERKYSTIPRQRAYIQRSNNFADVTSADTFTFTFTNY